ncbi:MAG: substrate-binding domain-containing protein [Ilumatobacteraceae bacterium]
MRKSHRLLAVPLALGMILAACSDDKKTSDTKAPASETTAAGGTETTAAGGTETTAAGETPGAAGLARAQVVVDANATAPTDIGPTIPLESVPEPKTVAWLQCSLPSCAAIGVGFKNATDALGWKLEVISYETDAAPAFQQAIDLGVDYVATTGTSQALIQDQIDAAAAAGIGYFSCFDTSEPKQEANNIWTQCGDATAVFASGDRLANQVIVDSGGTANVLMVNIPDFAVLVSEREGAAAAYEANCPGCKFTELPLTLDQLLAGEVPGAVVAALQADPSVDYVHIAFDGLSTGLTSVLADAGLLEGRKIVGVDFSGAVLQEIVDGTMAFWTANPKEYSAWLMVDAMARHSIGQDNTEERANALLPSFTVSSPEQAEPLVAGDGWPGPETMAEQFKTLWGV